MDALGVSHIDYLAIDIEGAELDVLETIDWTRFRIDVLTVEYHWDDGTNVKLRKIKKLFSKLKMYRQVPARLRGGDMIFVRTDLIAKLPVKTQQKLKLVLTN